MDESELMSKRHKNVCTTLNYIEHFRFLAFTVAGCISISAFTFLMGIPIGIMIFAIGLKIYAINARIKKCKSIVK